MTNQELYEYLMDLKDPEGWTPEQIYVTFIHALETNPTAEECAAWKCRVDGWLEQMSQRGKDD